jgi:hypothetical protein
LKIAAQFRVPGKRDAYLSYSSPNLMKVMNFKVKKQVTQG